MMYPVVMVVMSRSKQKPSASTGELSSKQQQIRNMLKYNQRLQHQQVSCGCGIGILLTSLKIVALAISMSSETKHAWVLMMARVPDFAIMGFVRLDMWMIEKNANQSSFRNDTKCCCCCYCCVFCCCQCYVAGHVNQMMTCQTAGLWLLIPTTNHITVSVTVISARCCVVKCVHAMSTSFVSHEDLALLQCALWCPGSMGERVKANAMTCCPATTCSTIAAVQASASTVHLRRQHCTL